jgi:hypothetical protein
MVSEVSEKISGKLSLAEGIYGKAGGTSLFHPAPVQG